MGDGYKEKANLSLAKRVGFFVRALGPLLEIIEEGGDTLQGRFALAFDFNFEGNTGLADAAKVLDALQRGRHADVATRDDGLSEAHFVHAIVDQHLDVVDLDDLVPQVGEQRKREVSVGDSALVRTLHFGSLRVDVYPLVVEGGVGKEVDALLVYLQPIGNTQLLA